MMPVGALSWIWKVLGSTALISLTLVHSIWPSGSRTAQRLSEGTTSSDVTGAPSCHSSPSRRVKVQVSLSSDVVHLSTICGLTCRLPSIENSVS